MKTLVGKVVKEMSEQGLVTDDSVILLLKSFITGKANLIQSPLLRFMNTVKDQRIEWIPLHMVEVLEEFSDAPSLSPFVKNILTIIVSEFERFRDAKDSSGDAWESLFLIVILIRSVVRKFDEDILHLDPQAFEGCSVSFNKPFKVSGADLNAIKKPSDYISHFDVPSHFPHIAIYRPNNAQFNEVDLIVVCWVNQEKKLTYGYQLKEGSEDPEKKKKKKKKPISFKFDKCWWIRGIPAQETSESPSGWQVAGEKTLREFFGKSGCHWTPKAWKKLKDEEKKLKDEEKKLKDEESL